MILLLRTALILSLASASAGATTIAVTTTLDQFGEDATKCSLREAIQAANTNAAFGGCPAGSASDLITLGGNTNPSHYEITRAGRLEDDNATGDFDLDSTGAIAIAGTTTRKAVIEGGGLDRIFDLACRSDMNVILLNLTIRDGDTGNDAAGGGALRACAHQTLITKVHFTNNTATRGGALAMPAFAGNVTITQSAFTRNRSFEGEASAIRHLGNTALLSLTNVTLSENVAAGDGALWTSGDVTMKNVTVAYNTANQYGGINAIDGAVTYDNSIFADNAARTPNSGQDLHCGSSMSVVSNGYNLYGRRNCTVATPRASDITGDPLFGTLADAGGSLPVHVLLPGSPATNSGAPVPNDGSLGHCPSIDQRGVQRLQCDRGAFEGRTTFAVDSTADAVDANPGNGVCQSTLGGCSLRAALMEAATQDTPVLITLPAGMFDVNIPGDDEDLAATGDLDIRALEGEGRILIGQGPDKTIIRGHGLDRVFDHEGPSNTIASIGLFGMRIEGGDTTHPGEESSVWDGGGARFEFPRSLTIDRVWFDSNSSGNYGGGLAVLQGSGSGPARITRSAFTRNHAARYGGGIEVGQTTNLSLSTSIIADNTADFSGGGFSASLTGLMELSYLTITGNRAGRAAGGMLLDGGEIITGLLVAGNHDGENFDSPDCEAIHEGAISAGYNLVGDAGDGSCLMTGDLEGNQIGVDPQLSQVSLLGGAEMPFAAPGKFSPARGAVPADRCAHGLGLLEQLDQLGNARPVNAHCTIGAMEASSDLIFANDFSVGYFGE
ncbi:choice-of-anchor Q domain-containing protein [Dokdonella sp.]|uniref:choice-of-anchor Q domain-containing protein n=1 Tax=Dokdonella sp. TaxID=2291710 RepID=UPI003784BAA2